MSDEEPDVSETELKDLITQTLEAGGLLARIRAQLRAGLYLALENEIDSTNQNLNFKNAFKNQMQKPDVKLVFCLVKEFLEYYNLKFTNAVFEKETFHGSIYNYENRQKLIGDIDIGIDSSCNTPILVQVLNIARSLNSVKRNENMKNASQNEINLTYEIPNRTTESEKTCTDSSIASDDDSCNVFEIKTTFKDSIHQSCNVTNGDKSEIKLNSEPTVMETNESVNKIEIDNTFENSSTIADECDSSNKEQLLIDLDRSVKCSSTHSSLPAKSLQDQSLSDKLFKLESSLNQSFEKRKDKTPSKPMSGLTSLTDLPPLQVKPRNSDTILLPSLYSKKSNLKEIDKLLDMGLESLDNYEEDFVLSKGLDIEKNFRISPIVSKIDTKKENIPSTVLKETQDNNTHTENMKNNITEEQKCDTSISEDLEFSSTADEYIQSPSNIE